MGRVKGRNSFLFVAFPSLVMDFFCVPLSCLYLLFPFLFYFFLFHFVFNVSFVFSSCSFSPASEYGVFRSGAFSFNMAFASAAFHTWSATLNFRAYLSSRIILFPLFPEQLVLLTPTPDRFRISFFPFVTDKRFIYSSWSYNYFFFIFCFKW